MTSISDTNVVNAPGGLVELAFNSANYINTAVQSTPLNLTSVTVICDGSPVIVEIQCVIHTYAQDGHNVGVSVDGGAIQYSASAGTYNALSTTQATRIPINTQIRLTPSAGVRTFQAKAVSWTGNSANSYIAGSVSIRVSKIIQASQLIVQTPNAPLVTSLPSNAIDGQEVRYLADNTNGIIWNFRYRAGSSSSYKWEFIGGSALRSSVASVGRQTNLNVFENLNGPTITVPLAGDYDLVAETGWNDAYDSVYLMQILAGSTGIQIARMRQIAYGGGEVVLTSRALAIAASTLIRPQYYIQVAQAVGYGWGASSIAATPIRVSA